MLDSLDNLVDSAACIDSVVAQANAVYNCVASANFVYSKTKLKSSFNSDGHLSLILMSCKNMRFLLVSF